MSSTLPPYKYCRKCGRYQFATDAYFVRDYRAKDGLCHICLECAERGKPVRPIEKSNHKKCNRCSRQLPPTEEFFFFRKGKPYGRCRECLIKIAEQSRLLQKERVPRRYHKPALIYFLRCPINGRIKIGYTSRGLRRRLQDIQAMSPVEIKFMGAIKGTKMTEMQLHERFDQWRVYGEWFEENEDLLTFVRENARAIWKVG